MAGFENDVLLCSNVNFNPGLPKPHLGLITTNGQLIIGSTALNAGGTHINVGSISSVNMTIGYSSPNITIEPGSQLATRYTCDTGVAAPAANNLNVFGSGSLTTDGAASNLTISLTGLTNHALLVGAGTSTITKLGPTATAGQILQSAGAAADPSFSTATYPSTAGTSGKILISNGTNIVSSTPTYPNASVTAGKIIISDGTNYVASTPTYPNASATSGKILISDGTNFVASTPTYPNASATSGKIIISDGTNFIASTPTFPNTATGTGTILRADGTNWVATTATYPATTTSQQILYSTANNVIGELTTANSKLPATNSSGTLAMRALSVVIQTFTANGTYTPTSGMLYCIIEIVGSGGGGGGSAATGAGTLAYGGGGGGGEYARGVFSAATVGASQAVTCPAGGAGGTAGNTTGTAGATTSVGALITAGGGGAGGGAAASANGLSSAAGAGGTGGAGGSIRINGGDGYLGFWQAGSFQIAGRGATSFFSQGVRGSATTGTGATGSGFGGGGGGGQGFTSAAAQAGGPGSSGLVVITEYVIA